MSNELDEEIFRGEREVQAQHRVSIPQEHRKLHGVGAGEEYILEVRTETKRERDKVTTSTAANGYRISLPEKYVERFDEGETIEISLYTIKRGTSAIDF